jgi:hypothetical protein
MTQKTLGILLGVALFACGRDHDAAEQSGDALTNANANANDAPVDLSATVETDSLEMESRACTVHVTFPEVDAKSDAATAAIRKVLVTPTTDALCKGTSPTDPVVVQSSFTVTTNASALLSLTISDDTFRSAAGTMKRKISTRSFDLHTGKRLLLRDVLTPAGIARARAACISTLVSGNERTFDQTSAAKPCDQAVLDDGAANVAIFAIQSDGLHLVIPLDPDPFAVGADGFTVSWKDLAGETGAVMADFLKATAH